MAPALDPTAFASASCPAHERAAVATCVRCGTFLCGECTELLGDAAYCASCVTYVRAHAAPSLLLKVMIGLEVIALASIPLVMLLPYRILVRVGETLVSVAILQRVPVLNAAAAGLGFWAAIRERRRLLHEGLAVTPWARWGRALAWVNLGFVAIQAVVLVRGLVLLFGHMPRP